MPDIAHTPTNSPTPHFISMVECVVCDGTGLLLDDVCPLCEGVSSFAAEDKASDNQPSGEVEGADHANVLVNVEEQRAFEAVEPVVVKADCTLVCGEITLTNALTGAMLMCPLEKKVSKEKQVRRFLKSKRPAGLQCRWNCEGTCWNDDTTRFTFDVNHDALEGTGANRAGNFTVRGTKTQGHLGFELVFENQHGAWPVTVRWDSDRKGLSGKDTRQETSARFEVTEDCDALLCDPNGKAISSSELVDERFPCEISFAWTSWEAALAAPKAAWVQEVETHLESLLPVNSCNEDALKLFGVKCLLGREDTFGAELARKTADLLVQGKKLSGCWVLEESLPGTKVQFTTRNTWSLSHQDGCFCLACAKSSPKTWSSVDDFVSFWADMTNTAVKSLFVSIGAKAGVVLDRVEGTLTKRDLQQLA